MPTVTVDLNALEAEISGLEARLKELQAVRKWLVAKLDVPAAPTTKGNVRGAYARAFVKPAASNSVFAETISEVVDSIRSIDAQPLSDGGMDHLKVHDAAAKVLEEFNHGLTLSQLTDVLEQRGFGINLANLKNALSTALTRHAERFKKTDDGRWHLFRSVQLESAN